MNKLGAVLAARIISELNELSVLVDRATHGLERAKKSGDDYYLDGVALNIHGFYSGLERIFERITIAEDKVVKYCMKNLEPFMVPKYVDFRIYGSKAKGTDIDGSGLDVMIILEDHSPSIESKIDDLIFEINLKYDCFITALFFSRKELDAGPLTESPIYKKIQQEGISW